MKNLLPKQNEGAKMEGAAKNFRNLQNFIVAKFVANFFFFKYHIFFMRDNFFIIIIILINK